MITTTLSSRSTVNKTLFLQQVKFTLKRYFYGELLYTILLLLVSVVPLYSQNYLRSASTNPYLALGGYAREVTGLMLDYRTGGDYLVMLLVFAVPILLAASLFGYLHNRRSVDFFHALPIPRETLFLSQFTSGIIIAFAPILFCQVLNLISYFIFPIQNASIGALFSTFFLETFLILAAIFVMFSICSLVAVSCSTTIEQLGYSCALTIIGPVLVIMWMGVCNDALYGYINSPGIAKYLSPIGIVFTTFLGKASIESIISLVVWLALGVGLLILGLRIYKKRQSESAEQLGRVTLLSRFVKIFAGTLGTFFITFLFSNLFFGEKWIYLLAALIGAPLGYIIVEAITAKGFSTTKKALPMVGLTTALMLVAGSYLIFDGFGYESYIPKTESVREVTLDMGGIFNNWNNYLEEDILKGTPKKYHSNSIPSSKSSITLRTPEAIDKVRMLQESIIFYGENSENYYSSSNIIYKTKPFGSVSRYYNTSTLQEKQIVDLIIDPEVVQTTYPAFLIIPEHVESISISDKLGDPVKVPVLDQIQIEQLLEAVRSDLLKQTAESVTGSGDSSEIAFLDFNLKDIIDVRDAGIKPLLTVDECSMLIQPSDNNTVALLKEWNIWPDKPDYSKITRLEILHDNRNNPFFSVEARKPVPSEYFPLKKYDYWRTSITDPALISAILEESNNISAKLTQKNLIEVSYPSNMSGTGFSFIEVFINNERLLEILNGTEIKAPYFLTPEEEMLYLQVKKDQGFDLSNPYQYNVTQSATFNETENYMDLEGNISVGEFFEKNLPELLTTKSDTVKNAMYNTPIETKDGVPLSIGNFANKEDGLYRAKG